MTLWKIRGKPKVARYWEMEDGMYIVRAEMIDGPIMMFSEYSDDTMSQPTKFKIQIDLLSKWRTAYQPLNH
eukprot:15257382-Ditylum_brightwellii.AAC.1